MIDLAGKKVTVVGLGRFGGGIGVTQWLRSQGADVTVSDRASADDLSGSVAQLDGLNVKLHLGGHDLDDFLNPGDRIEIAFEKLGTLHCRFGTPSVSLRPSRWPIRAALRKYHDG